jgi:hypothetical protein
MVPTVTMGDRLAHLGVLGVWLRVTPADCHWSQLSPRVKNPPEVDEQQLPVFRSPLKQKYPFFAHSGPRSEALYNEFVFLVAVVGSSKGYGDRH